MCFRGGTNYVAYRAALKVNPGLPTVPQQVQSVFESSEVVSQKQEQHCDQIARKAGG